MFGYLLRFPSQQLSRAMPDVLEFTNKSRALKSELDCYLGRGKTKTENAAEIREYSALEIKTKGIFLLIYFLFAYLLLAYVLLYRSKTNLCFFKIISK